MTGSVAMDLGGQTYGRLTVLERRESGNFHKTRWLCRCECGNEKVVYASALRAGLTQSCGCYRQETARIQGWAKRVENPGYDATHKRHRRVLGSATTHKCANCDRQAEDWAYDHTDPAEMTEVYRGYIVAYSTDPTRYFPLCRMCHTTFDSRRGPR